MEYAIGYIAITFVIQALAAVRNPMENTQTIFVASWFWILILPLVACSFALDAIGWGFDMARNDKIVYFRKPTNPQLKGFAVTLLTFEFQFYSKKKGA